MCYTVSIFASTHDIETDLGAVFDDAAAYQPYFHVSGFVHPSVPVVTNERPDSIDLFQWGLVPRWVKDRESADSIANKTLNARSETVFQKPSYRDAIVKRRGLLPVNGFIEWRHEDDIKIPHLVSRSGMPLTGSIFTLGCIWEKWTDRESGEILRSLSILTTEANILMSYVHNNKTRMPVVIETADRRSWLESDDREEITRLMRPLEEGFLQAAPLSRDVSRVKVNETHATMLDSVGETII